MSDRSRRRSGSRAARTAVLLVAALLVLQGPVGLVAYTSGQVERLPGLAVVGDRNGGIDIYPHHKMNSGETCTLADLTNNLDTDLTVTVSLREDSTQYGNLTLGSGSLGNETTFTLAAGASEKVGIELGTDIVDGTKVYFHVNATSEPVGLNATDRYSTVDDSQLTTRCDITL